MYTTVPKQLSKLVQVRNSTDPSHDSLRKIVGIFNKDVLRSLSGSSTVCLEFGPSHNHYLLTPFVNKRLPFHGGHNGK